MRQLNAILRQVAKCGLHWFMFVGEQRKILVSVLIRSVAALLFLVLPGHLADAHPHVFVETSARIIFDDQGRIVAIRNAWVFDEAYSAFVTLGMNDSGKLATLDQLRPIATTNIEQLQAFGWFNVAKIEDTLLEFTMPTDYGLMQDAERRLTLWFTLPLKVPVTSSNLSLQVYDPTYYVAFEIAVKDPVLMTNAPPGCSADVIRPNPLDTDDTQRVLAAKKQDVAFSAAFSARLTGQFRINCR
jgi:ABC-type uncharacterized transport system substrate-binding protein